LALDGGDEWSASRPGHFTPRVRAAGTYWIGGLVGPRTISLLVAYLLVSPLTSQMLLH